MSKSDEHAAVMHIYSSFNNTIVHITDLAGNTISRYSGGNITKQDRLKANPTTAMFIAKKIEEELKELGITELYVKMKGKTDSPGIGPGANSVIRTFSKDGFKILSISDITCVARGGPKKKGGRRGRRV
ncbi:30S ribosomal protein S11 [Candidatus Pacearchaeota archaeon]|nr:30S ribosomal protein S11 [Candidatus Pacearchaeota archaeon]